MEISLGAWKLLNSFKLLLETASLGIQCLNFKNSLSWNGVKGQSDLGRYIYFSGYAVSNNYAKMYYRITIVKNSKYAYCTLNENI